MSILLDAEETDFVYLKTETKATSGNLSVQLEKLSDAKYIEIEKTFENKKPRTICRITETGIEAMEKYIDALKDYIK